MYIYNIYYLLVLCNLSPAFQLSICISVSQKLTYTNPPTPWFFFTARCYAKHCMQRKVAHPPVRSSVCLQRWYTAIT